MTIDEAAFTAGGAGAGAERLEEVVWFESEQEEPQEVRVHMCSSTYAPRADTVQLFAPASAGLQALPIGIS